MKDCCDSEKKDGSYDLIVIGAGSAGFSASITAADAGKRVALLGHGTIGGTCVNVGCVPSKAMIRAAEAVHAAAAAKRFPGLSGAVSLDSWSRLLQAKDDLVGALRQKKYADLLPSYPLLDYIDEGPARLIPGGVSVGSRELKAPKIIIATGSRPVLPPIEGIETVVSLNSTELLSLEDLPKSLIFIGAGYIGVELAQMMARFGVRVTIVCRSRLLPGAEPEVSAALSEAFTSEGIRIVSGISYQNVSRHADGIRVCVSKDGEHLNLDAEKLVVTSGRRANSDALELDSMGVQTNARGAIIVGPDMQTSAPGIYAAGDVTDRDQFVYMAAYGAKLAARNAVLEQSLSYDNATMPWVVFSDPQVAGCGLSEADAIAAGYNVKTSVVPLDQVPRALAARDTRGVIKLVADSASDRLLGGQIIAPEGSDSIQTLAMALKAKMTAKALGETIFPYLTTVEGLKLAAQTFDMDVAKLSCCAG